MKTAKDYLEEANSVITRISTEDAIKAHASDDGGVWIDVRDSADMKKTGTIKGAKHVARGFMEFSADPDSPYYKDFLKRDGKYYLVCGAGGQAALAGKTLKDMGYTDVTNVGGVPDWKEAGGPTEEV
ncbi:rhodanese-like domain-containing protein [Loktanella sp. SALINAS62]|uniref:rhodanese-like domain-containing protein n=1 Tax=Loktanella sp. SALINAS62 TaxID=2706124 RepID=UPI001B8C9E10|nr:rhodanese-like domain-containing protein [Loktanella sp. SALINAS62]MBS1302375.1 rhodanese-like domain-containing protein [Loktanella sp. SALINAS62]